MDTDSHDRDRSRSHDRARSRSRSRDRRDSSSSYRRDERPRAPLDPMRKAMSREVAANEAAKRSRKECRVYVGNLAFGVKWNDLKDFMREGGSMCCFSLGSGIRSWGRVPVWVGGEDAGSGRARCGSAHSRCGRLRSRGAGPSLLLQRRTHTRAQHSRVGARLDPRRLHALPSRDTNRSRVGDEAAPGI